LAYVGLGDGDRAARIFRLLNPIMHAGDREQSERYRVEPYVVGGDVYGAPPWVGRGGWTWYTGSAAWLYRLGVEGILGLRMEEGDLTVDPCLPAAWDRVEAWVRVGKQQIHVTVDNPDGVGHGAIAITLDGTPVEGNRIHVDPSTAGGGQREVAVRLGNRDVPRHVETARGDETPREDQGQAARSLE
jgi:cyclic beta-1,2-glucan synthetase